MNGSRLAAQAVAGLVASVLGLAALAQEAQERAYTSPIWYTP